MKKRDMALRCLLRFNLDLPPEQESTALKGWMSQLVEPLLHSKVALTILAAAAEAEVKRLDIAVRRQAAAAWTSWLHELRCA
jgi:hypothetical protein